MDQAAQAFQALQRGDAASASRFAKSVLERDPRNFGAHMVLAMVAAGKGDLEAAGRSFEQAILLQPRRPDAHFNLGLVRAQQQRHHEALASFERTLQLNPSDQRAMMQQAEMLFLLSDWSRAARAFRQIANREPNVAQHWARLAFALQELGDFDGALQSFSMAAQLAPKDAVPLTAMGGLLAARGRYGEAIDALSKALALDPRDAQSFYARAVAQLALRNNEAALQDLERATALSGEAQYKILIDYVVQLHRAGRSALIDDVLSREAARAPIRALLAKGSWLAEQMMDAAAIDCFDKVLAEQHGFAPAVHLRSIVYLRSGKLERGFADYEARLHNRSDGGDLPGSPWMPDAGGFQKRLLIYPEQGLGDIVMFSRFARTLAERGHEVTLLAPAALSALLRSLHPQIAIVERGSPLPPVDAKCSIASLPAKLGVVEAALATFVPYLRASEEARAKWAARLEAIAGPRIGICWCGSIQHENDQLRSIPLSAFVSELGAGDRSLVRLQTDLRPGDAETLARAKVVDYAADLRSLDDTAAVIEAMDLVISVDTSIANLAGALGKPTWVLLPFAPDWRWQTQRSDSPWYPSARLYRQTRAGDWIGVFERVRADLSKWAADRGDSGAQAS